MCENMFEFFVKYFRKKNWWKLRKIWDTHYFADRHARCKISTKLVFKKCTSDFGNLESHSSARSIRLRSFYDVTLIGFRLIFLFSIAGCVRVIFRNQKRILCCHLLRFHQLDQFRNNIFCIICILYLALAFPCSAFLMIWLKFDFFSWKLASLAIVDISVQKWTAFRKYVH